MIVRSEVPAWLPLIPAFAIVSLAMSATILLTNVIPPLQVHAEETAETAAEEYTEVVDAAEDSSAAPGAEDW